MNPTMNPIMPPTTIPRAPPLTIALVAISVVVYALMNLVSSPGLIIAPLLISEYQAPTLPALPEIINGQYWRLVTPMFVHFNIFHIVFNLLWVWELGRLIEWRQGMGALGALTVGLSVLSNLTQYSVSGALFGGMSGVIYGYFGYIWVMSMGSPRFGIRLNPAIVKLLLVWFLIGWSGILETWFDLRIANTAHTAGLLGGVAVALIVAGVARITAPKS